MRILIFTTKWIGAQCVEFLLDQFPEDEYTIVVCEPEGEIVIEMLNRRGVSYLSLNEETINILCGSPMSHFDWLLNLWGGYIFKESLLTRARRTLNIHPAYLPYCRGRDPVVWAIRNGYPAGVTLHMIAEGVDEGAIWYQEQVPYEHPITGGHLYTLVVERSWKCFCEQWSRLRNINTEPQTQIVLEGNRTFRRADLLDDQFIDVDADDSLKNIFTRLLAHDFSPGYKAQILFNGKKYNANLNLTPAENGEM